MNDDDDDIIIQTVSGVECLMRGSSIEEARAKWDADPDTEASQHAWWAPVEEANEIRDEEVHDYSQL